MDQGIRLVQKFTIGTRLKSPLFLSNHVLAPVGATRAINLVIPSLMETEIYVKLSGSVALFDGLFRY